MPKVLLFDDEKLALKTLERQLNQFKNVNIMGMYTSYHKLMEAVSTTHPDIVFIDIETPVKSGLKIAQEIQDIDSAIEIVFVTAHRKYAYEAYEIEAADYLLKPVKKERLQRILDRAVQTRGVKKHRKIDVMTMKRFEVRNEAGELIKWRTKKVAELLAFLVHHKGQELTTDLIIDVLWPYDNAEKAKRLLYTTMYYLRKEISSLGVPRDTNGHNYLLPETSVECDADRLVELISRLGEQFSSQTTDILEQVFSIYRGGYLEENYFDWAEGKRTELESRFVNGILKISEDMLKQKRLMDVEFFLKRLIILCPHHEQPYRLLIEVYRMVNNFKGVENTYKSLCEMVTELGVEPNNQQKI